VIKGVYPNFQLMALTKIESLGRYSECKNDSC